MIMHISGVGGFFGWSYRTPALRCDVFDLEEPPLKLATHTCFIIGFDCLVAFFLCLRWLELLPGFFSPTLGTQKVPTSLMDQLINQ